MSAETNTTHDEVIAVRVSKKLKKKVRVAASLEDKDMTSYLRNLLEEQHKHIDLNAFDTE